LGTFINSVYHSLPSNHTEGVGSCYQRQVLTYLLSLKLNYGFRLTLENPNPFHLEKPEYQSDEALKFFNHLAKKSVGHAPHGCLRHSSLWMIQDLLKQMPDKSFDLEFTWSEIRALVSETGLLRNDDYLSEFRRHLRQESLYVPPVTKLRSREIEIGVHIRNYSPGDTQLKEKSRPWEIFTEYYDNFNNPSKNEENYYHLIQTISKNHIMRSPKDLSVTIYSQGLKTDFESLLNKLTTAGYTVQLHLNRTPFHDLFDLIHSDALLLAQSAFSYLASLCSGAPKYIGSAYRDPMTFDTRVIPINDRL
jgi:hypothetical protein